MSKYCFIILIIFVNMNIFSGNYFADGKINEPIDIGNSEITINSVHWTSGEIIYGKLEAKKDEIFCKINITIENKGNETINGSNYMNFIMKDDDGYIQENESYSRNWVKGSLDMDLFPNSKNRADLVFIVNLKSKNLKLFFDGKDLDSDIIIKWEIGYPIDVFEPCEISYNRINGTTQGELITYFLGTNNIKSFYNYKDDLKNGEYKIYNMDNEIIENGNYKNNKLDGKLLKYYNKQISEEFNYTNGSQNGSYKNFWNQVKNK